jgi:hypothetical protein
VGRWLDGLKNGFRILSSKQMSFFDKKQLRVSDPKSVLIPTFDRCHSHSKKRLDAFSLYVSNLGMPEKGKDV